MDSLVYNCHDIVRICASGLTGSLEKKLNQGLGHFRAEGTLTGGQDIIILPMDKVPEVPVFSRHLNHIFGFTTVAYQDRIAVTYLHKGRPEFCLFFSSPGQLTLLFRPVKAQENRFFGLVLFSLHLMARQNGALMAHAAVAVKKGRAVAISGHHGMGKTPILLSLLKEGWQSLGDDKIFVTAKGLFTVEPYLAVSQYHFDLLPWLSGFLPQAPASPLSAGVRRMLDRTAGRVWPGGVPVKVYRLLNPGMKIDLREPQFNNVQAEKAEPAHWIILRQGAVFEEKNLTRDQGIGALANVQEMFFSHRQPMEKTLCLYGGNRVNGAGAILARLLPETTFSLVTCTGAEDIPQICERVADHVR